MAKLTPDKILEILRKNQKGVKYDTRDWSIEMVLSKFNRKIEDSKTTEIDIPFYQREFIWKDKQISQLIETLLLGLPLPLIFLEEMEDQTLEIIDGSQRIRALDRFFKNEEKLSKLEILKELNGLYFKDFPPAIQRQLNNTSLRIIVMQHLERYETDIANEIFKRINTAGTNATDMEAKKGSEYGDFLKLIFKELSVMEKFNNLAGFGNRYLLRGYQQEFIVKFFAFYDLYKKNKEINFKGTLKQYLEKVIKEENEKCKNELYKDELKQRFNNTVQFIIQNGIMNYEKYLTRKKEKLLPIMIAVAIYLDNNDLKQEKRVDIWTDEFERNASTASLSSLKENIDLILNKLNNG